MSTETDIPTTTPVEVRELTSADLPEILELLTAVGLPHAGLAEKLDTGIVARSQDLLVGSAILEIYGSSALLRSVAVAPSMQGKRLGHQLIKEALNLAEERGVRSIYLLTETAATFFPRFGFAPIERTDVDESVRQSTEFATTCPTSAVAMARSTSKS